MGNTSHVISTILLTTCTIACEGGLRVEETHWVGTTEVHVFTGVDMLPDTLHVIESIPIYARDGATVSILPHPYPRGALPDIGGAYWEADDLIEIVQLPQFDSAWEQGYEHEFAHRADVLSRGSYSDGRDPHGFNWCWELKQIRPDHPDCAMKTFTHGH